MTKKKIIGLFVLVLLVAAGGYLYFNFTNIVLRASEKVATNALGVNVTIGGLDLSLAEKRVSVSDIRIANPSGYKGRYIMQVADVTIGLDTASKQLIDFNNIDVTGSTVNVEVNEKGMNVLDLKKKLASGSSKEETPATTEDAIKVIVKKMAINATTINTSVTFLDRDIASITMPSVRFSNIGQGGGVDADEAINKVFTKYLTSIQTEVSKQNLLRGVSVPGVNEVNKAVDDAKDSLKQGIQGFIR